jgi:hypothetical protein
LKAIGSISDINQQPSIEKASYTLITSTNTAATLDTATSVSTQQSGSFYIGIDLENYANADKGAIFSGWNSNTDDIYFIPTFNQNNPAVASCRFDAFAMFDTVICFENGTAYVKY